MAGTSAGGIKARETNLKKDPNFYSKIGTLGGKRKVPKGYATNKTLASLSGYKGGRVVRRKYE